MSDEEDPASSPGPSSSGLGMNLISDGADYDSVFSDAIGRTEELQAEQLKKKKRHDLATKERPKKETKAHHSQFTEEVTMDEGRRQRGKFLELNAYDRHKQLVNEYLLYFPGSTQMMKRDPTKDRRDIDVVRENHRFLWDDDEKDKRDGLTWGQALAKKYYEKLFKEYCICDVSRYKENKVAMRWRVQDEVVSGKGQFLCGARKCEEKDRLRTWEVNFGYVEDAEKKNALVKVRLCPDCSYKINYHHRKKEVTKKKSKKPKKEKKKKKDRKRRSGSSSSSEDEESKAKRKKLHENEEEKKIEKQAADVWSAPVEVEQEKSRDQDFSEFLDDLFL